MTDMSLPIGVINMYQNALIRRGAALEKLGIDCNTPAGEIILPEGFEYRALPDTASTADWYTTGNSGAFGYTHSNKYAIPRCSHCGNKHKEDSRGNCASCGAPI